MGKYEELKIRSMRIRLDVLKMIRNCGYGHLGGSLSIVELMSVLYGKQLKYKASDPQWDQRDMVILSKGHCGPAWYAALAIAGFFPESELLTLNKNGTRFPSHPDRTKTPGVDMTTGSLGQGVSIAAGVAMAFNKLHQENRYVYVICGDGELDEGECWEAFGFIANYRLNHCIVIIDENKRQLDGYTKDVMNPFDLCQKMKAFGFYSIRCDGGSEESIDEAINQVKTITNQAVCIVLNTVKGQGVKYFEELTDNHSVKFNVKAHADAADAAIADLEKKLQEVEK